MIHFLTASDVFLSFLPLIFFQYLDFLEAQKLLKVRFLLEWAC